jgi:hypothetical protein
MLTDNTMLSDNMLSYLFLLKTSQTRQVRTHGPRAVHVRTRHASSTHSCTVQVAVVGADLWNCSMVNLLVIVLQGGGDWNNTVKMIIGLRIP